MEVVQPDLRNLMIENARRSKTLFTDSSGGSARKKLKLTTDTNEPSQREKDALSVRLHAEYQHVRELPSVISQKQGPKVTE